MIRVSEQLLMCRYSPRGRGDAAMEAPAWFEKYNGRGEKCLYFSELHL